MEFLYILLYAVVHMAYIIIQRYFFLYIQKLDKSIFNFTLSFSAKMVGYELERRLRNIPSTWRIPTLENITSYRHDYARFSTLIVYVLYDQEKVIINKFTSHVNAALLFSIHSSQFINYLHQRQLLIKYRLSKMINERKQSSLRYNLSFVLYFLVLFHSCCSG